MKTLVIVNDPPYGTERAYNALRLATAIAKREGETVRAFLLGDAAAVAKAGQKVPDGYYNLERMLRALALAKAEIGVCGTCMDARGITPDELVAGARRSTLDELTAWSLWADKVLVFCDDDALKPYRRGARRGRGGHRGRPAPAQGASGARHRRDHGGR